jgi:hypothetical protein
MYESITASSEPGLHACPVHPYHSHTTNRTSQRSSTQPLTFFALSRSLDSSFRSTSWSFLRPFFFFTTCVRARAIVPSTSLAAGTNILEELPERRRLSDFRAKNTALLRRRKSKVTVESLLHPLLAQDWHIELKHSRLDQ